MEMCSTIELSGLLRSVEASKKLQLDMFFTAKTHKVGIPFRVIFTERNSWKYHVAFIICEYLRALDLRNPFMVQHFECIMKFLREGAQEMRSAFFVDV